MSRSLSNAYATELSQPDIRPAFFFEGVFPTGILRLWTGTGDISWGGSTWIGNGWLHSIEGVEENDDISATGMDVILNGVPQSIISLVLGAQQGNLGKLWFGLFDDNYSLIETPYLLFVGRLDVPTIDDRVEGPVIQISYESRLIDLEKSKEYRYTTEGQKIFDPNDRGFEYVESLQTWKGQWGKTEKEIKKKERDAVRKKGWKRSPRRR